ncbi:MAG: pentapeptide repeat-containing protein, partial [Rivularia sp. (in: cyanobacteria)]
SSVASGTPGFIPPEEYFGRDLTEASDLYSLGVTLICLLSGTRSVDVGKLINDEYRFDFKCLPSGIDPQFVRWLRKMVEPNIKNRFANAAVALEALKPIPILLKSNTKSKSKSIEGSIFGQTFAVPLLILIAIAGTQSIQKTSVYQQRVIERQRRTIDHLLYKKEHLEDKIDRINRLQELLMKREQAILLDKLNTTKECNFCNFQNANLANTQLQGISLKKGNLQHSNLVNANLKGSNLSDVNLLGARLSSAILTDANLSNANLDNADLNNADLRGADLRGAKFYFTQLDGADLRGANLRYTNLNGVNLNNVKLTGAIMPDGSTHK